MLHRWLKHAKALLQLVEVYKSLLPRAPVAFQTVPQAAVPFEEIHFEAIEPALENIT